jgi:hypothetical protein
MSLSITSTTPSTSYARSSTTTASAAPKPPDPAELFKQLDTDQKGYITASDLVSAQVSLSPEGTQRSDADAQAKAQAAIKRMDSDGDGKVTQQEFTAAAPAKPPASGGGKPQGAPPAGGGGGGGKAGAASSSSSKTYDPADANEDGTVSEQERQAYDAQHPKASESAARDRHASQAVQTYEAVATA